MIISQGSSVRLPVRLLDATGVPQVGKLPADIWDGTTVGHCTVVRADGTLTDITLSNGVNFFEIGSTAPGLYHILISALSTAISGTLQLAVFPASGGFVGTVVTAQVA